MPEIIINLLGISVIISTLLPLTLQSHWTVRIFDFPRLQTIIIALFLIAFHGVLAIVFGISGLSYLIILALLVVVIYQAIWIYPYTVLKQKEIDNSTARSKKNSLKILSSNVLQTNTGYEKLISHIHRYDPDIIVTLETDKIWEKNLSLLKTSYPYTIAVPQDNLYGMHLFSRYPLKNSEVNYRVKEDIPSITTNIIFHSDTQDTMNKATHMIKVYFIHPMPPSPTESKTSEGRDKELILVAQELKDFDGPCIVAGDLNDVAWSMTTRLFQKISLLLDPRIGRGFYNTFHTRWPIFRWPLDHIFISHHFTLNSIKRLPCIGSDHFPIFIDIQLEQKTINQSNEAVDEPLSSQEEKLVEERLESNNN